MKVKMLKSTKFQGKYYDKDVEYSGDLKTLVDSGVAVEIAEKKATKPKKFSK